MPSIVKSQVTNIQRRMHVNSILPFSKRAAPTLVDAAQPESDLAATAGIATITVFSTGQLQWKETNTAPHPLNVRGLLGVLVDPGAADKQEL